MPALAAAFVYKTSLRHQRLSSFGLTGGLRLPGSSESASGFHQLSTGVRSKAHPNGVATLVSQRGKVRSESPRGSGMSTAALQAHHKFERIQNSKSQIWLF